MPSGPAILARFNGEVGQYAEARSVWPWPCGLLTPWFRPDGGAFRVRLVLTASGSTWWPRQRLSQREADDEPDLVRWVRKVVVDARQGRKDRPTVRLALTVRGDDDALTRFERLFDLAQ